MSQEGEFTQDQPCDGDQIVACNHLEEDDAFHFYKFPSPVEALAPDGRLLKPKWLIICDKCFKTGVPPTSLITADAIWKGDEPIVKENNQKGY